MLKIYAEKRTKLGKSASRNLRNINQKIPGIIYGINKPTIYISVDQSIVLNIQNYSQLYESPIIISILNEEYLVYIKSIQKHCYKKKFLHIDLVYK